MQNTGPFGAFFGAEQAGIHPMLRPALFDELRFVTFWNFTGHVCTQRPQAAAMEHSLYGRRARRVNHRSRLAREA